MATGVEAQPKKVDEDDGYDSGNIVTNVDLGDSIIPHENRLLKYDTVSWVSKLFTMSVADFKKYQRGSKEYTEVIISETGATSKYSIDEVQLTTIPPGTNTTKNGTLMKGTITLSEQGSMTLFDELQAASLMLGYSKLMDIPLFLEISFVGYNRYGEHLPVTVPGANKLWRLHIVKVNTSMANNGGTTVYEIIVAPLVFSIETETWMLSEQIEMIATRDVKSFISEFSKKLNGVVNSQVGYLTRMFSGDLQPNNFFTFHVHPAIGELVLINSSSQDTANDKSATGAGTKRFVFNAGETIGTIVDKIMDAAQVKGIRHDTGKIQKRQFVHVIPVSKYIGYDRFRKKHVYRYDIYVVPYTTLDYQDVDDTKNTNNLIHLKKLLNEAHPDTKFNMKKYEYMWSGLNTEILSLEFDFNQAYAVIAAKNLKSLYDGKNRKGSKTANITPHDQIVSPDEIQQLYLRTGELAQMQNRTEAEDNEFITSSLQLSSNVEIESEAEQLIRPSVDNRAYLETFSKNVDLTSYIGKYNGVSMKIEVPVDYQNVSEISSGTDDSNSTQTEVSKRLIRSNYYNDAFLIKLEMQVVGDPYWLGKSEQDLIAELDNIISGATVKHNPLDLSMNILNCEPCFVLNLHPARHYDEFTGLATAGPASVFRQAVYRVNRIESTFNGDGFTQNLTASIITRSVNKE